MTKNIYKNVSQLYKISFCLLLLLASFLEANAQYLIKEADVEFALNNYYKAATLYTQAYDKKQTLHAAERAAESYAAQHDFKEAETWYAIVVAMPNSKPKNNLAYAMALQSNNKYAEAKEQYKKYVALNGTTGGAEEKLFIASCDSAIIWMQNPSKVLIVNEKGLNTAQSDWSPVFQSGNIVFASDRTISGSDPQQKDKPFFKFDGPRKPNKNIDLSSGNSYLRLYEKDKNSNKIHFFPLNAATEYHIGPATFTGDGKTMYFASSQTLKEARKPGATKNRSKVENLAVEIYYSTKDSLGKWSEPKPFRYNSAEGYSVGDPFITADGKQLYFSSNIPQGMGGMDLYVCNRTADGDWDSPINLREINTVKNERSPTIAADSALYFSSDGLIGMGGLDIFKSVKSDGQFGVPSNMHYPINSSQDDFAFNMYSENEGFLSSDRIGGLGSDDIYRVAIEKLAMLNLKGKVFDKDSSTPLANATVILSQNSDQLLKVETDETGSFSFKFADSTSLELLAEKTGYVNNKITLVLKGLRSSAPFEQNLYLEKIAVNKVIKLENIYYDFNEANIRPDAATELDKLVKIMQENPSISIELGSHTDSRGSDAYNLKLSQNRADAAIRYIISKGIDQNRIEAKGYGEAQPVNGCVNGVKCTEADYQLNRRTEFKVTKE